MPGRRNTRVAAAVALGAVAAVYGYNVYQNVSADARAAAACSRFVAATRSSQEATHTWSSRVFPDVSAVERDNVAGAQELCSAVRGRLAWWRFNLLNPEYRPPRDTERDDRLRAALAAAAERCPKVAQSILDAAPLKQPKDQAEKALVTKQKKALVDGICGSYATARSHLNAPAESVPVLEWPEHLEAMANGAEKILHKRPHPGAPH